MMLLLFSIHDVTPFHLPRLRRAEALFAGWGITRATYLLVPRFHRGYPVDDDGEFAQWLRDRRPCTVDWGLHGYYHRVVVGNSHAMAAEPPGRNATGRILAAADEGEFRSLDAGTARQRLDLGRAAFRACLGVEPSSFVAPRWELDARLLSLLAEQGMTWTEDRHGVRHLPSGTRFAAPVITWATRTLVRRLTSRLGAPLIACINRKSSILRIAVHPFDFDEPATVRSIERVVRGAASRRQVGYDDLLSMAAPLSTPDSAKACQSA